MERNLGKIYVTGADGFIGSHLVELLIEEGHEVTALCQYNSLGSYGWLDQLAGKSPKNLSLLLGDIRDAHFLAQTTKGHQTLLHLAALIAIPYSYQAPESYFHTNTLGSIHVAQACLQNSIQRLVHTSTSEVYGTARFVPITEEHPLQAQSPYSASKMSGDLAIESFVKSFKLPATTLRPFNTYGPRQSLRAVIPTIIAQLVAGQKTLRLGSLTPTRDFNYVEDTARAFVALAKAPDSAVVGKVFNAGSGKEVTIGDTAKKIAQVLGVTFEFSQESERLRPQASEVERLLADSSSLQRVTDWRPLTSFEQGLAKTIAWFKETKVADPTKYHV